MHVCACGAAVKPADGPIPAVCVQTFGEGAQKVKVYHHYAYYVEAAPPFRYGMVNHSASYAQGKSSTAWRQLTARLQEQRVAEVCVRGLAHWLRRCSYTSDVLFCAGCVASAARSLL